MLEALHPQLDLETAAILALNQPVCHSYLERKFDENGMEPEKFAGRLKGKVVLVTGASNGIGRATALAFAAAGAGVACVARREALLDEVVAEIRQKHNVPTLAVPADLTDPATPKLVIDRTTQSLGPVDILVNNAGIVRLGKLADEPDFKTWWRVVQLNQQAPAALIHAVLPSMVARKTGYLINVTSTGGAHDIPYITAYATSKAATIKLHQNLAFELDGTVVMTFNIHPGNLWTGLAQQPATANLDSLAKDEKMRDLIGSWQTGIKYQSFDLAANIIVAVCVEERCKVLNGKYVDAEQDLDEVLKACENGTVDRERMYHLKIDEL